MSARRSPVGRCWDAYLRPDRHTCREALHLAAELLLFAGLALLLLAFLLLAGSWGWA